MTWRTLTVAERQLAWMWAGLALAVLVLQPLWSAVAPLLAPCAFRSLTGLPCPTCGATRAALALLDGRALEAVRWNPMVALGLAGFLSGGVVAPLWAWRAGSVPALDRRLPVWSRAAIVALLAANWAWVITTS